MHFKDLNICIFMLQGVLGIHVALWIAQFIGHGVFEKRAPALLESWHQVKTFRRKTKFRKIRLSFNEILPFAKLRNCLIIIFKNKTYFAKFGRFAVM